MATAHDPQDDVVVALDGGVLAPGHAVLNADDPLFVRGDGVFETLLLRDGRASLLEAHLARLGSSAAILGLAPPKPAAWRTAVATAVQTPMRTGRSLSRNSGIPPARAATAPSANRAGLSPSRITSPTITSTPNTARQSRPARRAWTADPG